MHLPEWIMGARFMKGRNRTRLTSVSWLVAVLSGLVLLIGMFQPPVSAQSADPQARTTSTTTTTRTISKRTYTRTINSSDNVTTSAYPPAGTNSANTAPSPTTASPSHSRINAPSSPTTTITRRTYTRTIPSERSTNPTSAREETTPSPTVARAPVYSSKAPSQKSVTQRQYTNAARPSAPTYTPPPSKAPVPSRPARSEAKPESSQAETVPATTKSTIGKRPERSVQKSASDTSVLPSTPAGKVPDRATVNQILRSTIFSIEASYAMQDYDLLWGAISPRLQSEMNKAQLQAGLASLHKSGLPLKETLGAEPVFELEPYLIDGGRLRLRGYYDLTPRDVRFDLIYAHHDGLWRLDAIAFAPGG